MSGNKLYPCKNCGTKVRIRSKGLCPACREAQRREDGTLPQKKYSIPKLSKKRATQKKEERACLDGYFDFHLLKLAKSPYSEESGTLIVEPTTANVCHLLPKRKTGGFPSVKCHLDNVVYLTLQEHTTFDKLLDERDYEKLESEFPNVWNTVCQRMEKLLNVCSERNKFYFSFLEYLKTKEND